MVKYNCSKGKQIKFLKFVFSYWQPLRLMVKYKSNQYGVLAQLGERLPCKQKVVGSTPTSSTSQYKISKRTSMGNPTRNKVCRLRETSLVYIFKCIDTKELTREPLLHLVKMKILICFSCSRVFLYADWTKEDLGSPAKRCVPKGICFEYSGPRQIWWSSQAG